MDVAENKKEVEWVAQLFPWSRRYLDVYDHFGLLCERSVFAHCIHLDQQDRKCMANTGEAAAFSQHRIHFRVVVYLIVLKQETGC